MILGAGVAGAWLVLDCCLVWLAWLAWLFGWLGWLQIFGFQPSLHWVDLERIPKQYSLGLAWLAWLVLGRCLARSLWGYPGEEPLGAPSIYFLPVSAFKIFLFKTLAFRRVWPNLPGLAFQSSHLSN